MTDESFLQKLRSSPLFKSFLFYSAFRAVYGFGILFVAYFFATPQMHRGGGLHSFSLLQ